MSSARVPHVSKMPSLDTRAVYKTDDNLNTIMWFDNRSFPHSTIYVGEPCPGMFEVGPSVDLG